MKRKIYVNVPSWGEGVTVEVPGIGLIKNGSSAEISDGTYEAYLRFGGKPFKGDIEIGSRELTNIISNKDPKEDE
jgi:hypothetical protein